MNSEIDDARRGADALATLKNRELDNAPDGLFDQLMSNAVLSQNSHGGGQRFWLGAGFGGAVAASLFALALALGWFGSIATNEPEIAEFLVALNEPRQMDVAIETDRPLQGATISILLSGDIELDGFSGRRELTWSEDLEAGINRLSLPVLAMGERGGQMVVRLSHPLSEQVFIIHLRTDA